MKLIGLFFFMAVLGMSNFAEAQEWVLFEGEIPENAVMPTDENRLAGAICRMTGPRQVSPIHLLGSVQKFDGEFVCRGATYSGRGYRPAKGKVVINDPEFEVLVIADVPAATSEGMVPEEEVQARIDAAVAAATEGLVPEVEEEEEEEEVMEEDVVGPWSEAAVAERANRYIGVFEGILKEYKEGGGDLGDLAKHFDRVHPANEDEEVEVAIELLKNELGGIDDECGIWGRSGSWRSILGLRQDACFHLVVQASNSSVNRRHRYREILQNSDKGRFARMVKECNSSGSLDRALLKR